MPYRRLFTLLLFPLCLSCSGFFSEKKPTVRVEKPLVQEQDASLILPATLVSSEKLELKFPLDIKIESVEAHLGEKVRSGDPLFSINAEEWSQKQSQLRAKLTEKEAVIRKNEYFTNNRNRLISEGKIDTEIADSLENEIKKFQAEAENIRGELATLDRFSSQIKVAAPFEGIITETNISPGTRISSNQKVLTLVKADPIHVRFFLPANESRSVSLNTNVLVTIKNLSGETRTAAIGFIHPELDPRTGEFEVRAFLPNPNQTLKGGMDAEVKLTSKRRNKIILISKSSLLKEDDREYVYVIRENKAWPIRIFTAPSDNEALVTVEEGLSTDDLVVTDGKEKLKGGMEIDLWR